MKFCQIAALGFLAATQASGQEGSAPLSAIDWLSQSVTVPATAPQAQPPKAAIDEPPIADSASTPGITVTPLDAPSPDPVGLLPPEVTGLPRTLWSSSEEALLVTLVQAEAVNSLPAIEDLMVTLMLAEADAPLGAGPDGALFLARIDNLLEQGVLDPALALLEQAEPESPELFRRYFDVALLTGEEDRACDLMQSNAALAPTYPARIFCLARTGDWNAAALTLNTQRALGDVSEEEEALLARFLDPELFEGEPALKPPSRPSPLVFRMREAIGEGLPTANLPRAFAHADLRDTTGWKGQLEAVERLARHGAVSENVLQNIYTARTPAASGGVWDRVEAVQQFDVAINARDPGAVAATIGPAWEAVRQARIEVPFARLYSEALQALPLTGAARETATTIGLLSPDYEAVAIANPSADAFLVALARGIPQSAEAGSDTARAIQAAFGETAPPETLKELTADRKLGEALLRAIALFNVGVTGDRQAVTDALALLRHVGLEDVARRAGLQLLLLDRDT